MSQPYAGFGATRSGQSKQVNKALRGMADDMKRKQSVAVRAVPKTAKQYECVITDLRQQLAEALALIKDMRASVNGDTPAAADVSGFIDSATLARKSGVAVCTICRNADKLGGIKLGGDWLFPATATYGRKRKAK